MKDGDLVLDAVLFPLQGLLGDALDCHQPLGPFLLCQDDFRKGSPGEKKKRWDQSSKPAWDACRTLQETTEQVRYRGPRNTGRSIRGVFPENAVMKKACNSNISLSRLPSVLRVKSKDNSHRSMAYKVLEGPSKTSHCYKRWNTQ